MSKNGIHSVLDRPSGHRKTVTLDSLPVKSSTKPSRARGSGGFRERNEFRSTTLGNYMNHSPFAKGREHGRAHRLAIPSILFSP
jgi:hypothetical protein